LPSFDDDCRGALPSLTPHAAKRSLYDAVRIWQLDRPILRKPALVAWRSAQQTAPCRAPPDPESEAESPAHLLRVIALQIL